MTARSDAVNCAVAGPIRDIRARLDGVAASRSLYLPLLVPLSGLTAWFGGVTTAGGRTRP